jgi:hypothetical protein
LCLIHFHLFLLVLLRKSINAVADVTVIKPIEKIPYAVVLKISIYQLFFLNYLFTPLQRGIRRCRRKYNFG